MSDDEVYGLYFKAFRASLKASAGDNPREELHKAIINGLREVHSDGYGQGWDSARRTYKVEDYYYD